MAIAFGIFSVIDLLFCHSRAGGNLDFQPFLDPSLRGDDNFRIGEIKFVSCR
jgi:hypothetical protein